MKKKNTNTKTNTNTNIVGMSTRDLTSSGCYANQAQDLDLNWSRFKFLLKKTKTNKTPKTVHILTKKYFKCQVKVDIVSLVFTKKFKCQNVGAGITTFYWDIKQNKEKKWQVFLASQDALELMCVSD